MYLKTLARQVGSYRTASVLSVVFALSEVVTEVFIPYTMAMVIDRGVIPGDIGCVVKYGMVMAFMAFLSLVFGTLCGRFAAKASSGFARNLRDALFVNIQRFSFRNIDRYSTAGLVTRLTTDVTNLQNAYQMLIRMCVRAPFTLLTAFFMAFMTNRQISVIFLYAVLVLGFALGFIIRHATKAFSEVFARYDDLNASVQENVSGIRVVKSFVREDYEKEKFSAAAERIYALFVKAESMITWNFPIMMAVSYACIIALSWEGAHMITAGSLTTGQLTSLFTYTMNILVSLMMLSMAFVMMTMSQASAKRIGEVLTEEPSIREPESPVTAVPDGSVEFRHVSFSYGSRNVLTDAHLSIRSGETVGIIGGTGSSKTSLVSLIPRLYDVTEGELLVGGRNVKEYSLRTLRDAVGMVLQKNTLFSGTILENLRWGDENAPEEEVLSALRSAAAYDFVMAFPDGLKTRIEQGGTNVSGGQRQRLCIARALLKKPKILILDDSTSAVDTATDARIRKALKEDLPETTKIIISQRISGVKDADRILVLDEGRIDAFGTHEELLKENAIYRSVAAVQAEGGADFDHAGDADASGREA